MLFTCIASRKQWDNISIDIPQMPIGISLVNTEFITLLR